MKHLNQITGQFLQENQSRLAEQVVARQFARRPELETRYGQGGRQKCLQDAGYHLAYLAEAVQAGSPQLFADYVAWAKVMLGHRGIAAEDLAWYLEALRDVLSDSLPGEQATLTAEMIDSGLRQLPSLPVELPELMESQAPLAPVARDYLEHLLRGERHLASAKIMDAVASGTSVKDIYIHVFQQTQYEIGRLWQINQISVAQEHYCTAATQLIMSQLYPYIFSSEKGPGTLVATCVAGDLHELGIRMVADFFEMDGWNTFYLGANTPAPAVVDTLKRRKALVLGISATISYHVHAVRELITSVRRDEGCHGVKILVGGYPFNIATDLWQDIGADGCASDAHQAIQLANQLVGLD